MIRRNKLTAATLGILMATGLQVNAQLYAQFPTQFMASAQSQSLGRTFASSTTNALDATLNPATLAQFRDFSTALAIANTALDFEKLSASAVLPVGKNGGFGLSYHLLQTKVSAFDGGGQLLSKNRYRVQSLIVAYGRQVTPNLSFGLSGRLLFLSHIRDDEPEYIGLSFSALYRLPFQTKILENIQIGFLAENLAQPEITPADNREILPREFRVLIEKPFQIGGSRLDLIHNLVLLDKREMDEMGIKQRLFAHWGVQVSHESRFFLRGGFIQNGLVWGAGVRMYRFTFDYSYGDYNKGNFPKTFQLEHFVSVSFVLSHR